MSYHGFGISFEASASTSGGASASSSGGGGSTSTTGPKTAIPMGPQCGAGYRPNAMYATTPTALLPKLPISPLCLPLPAAPAQPALQPPAVALKVPVYSSAAIAAMKAKPGINPNLLFMSSTPTAPVIEESGVGTYVLIGLAVLAVGGAGYYAYKKMGTKKAATA